MGSWRRTALPPLAVMGRTIALGRKAVKGACAEPFFGFGLLVRAVPVPQPATARGSGYTCERYGLPNPAKRLNSPRIRAIVRQLPREVVGDVVLRQDRRVAEEVGDGQAQAGRLLRKRAVPQRPVEGDERAARALHGNRLGDTFRQRGLALAPVRAWHAGEGTVFAGVVRQAPVAVGVQRVVAPGQRDAGLVGVQAKGIAVAFARPLHEAVVRTEAGRAGTRGIATGAEQVVDERSGHRIHGQIAEHAVVGAELHQLELARLRAGDAFQEPAKVAVVQRAFRPFLHGELAADQLLGFVQQLLHQLVDHRRGNARHLRRHHGVALLVQLRQVRRKIRQACVGTGVVGGGVHRCSPSEGQFPHTVCTYSGRDHGSPTGGPTGAACGAVGLAYLWPETN